MSEVVRLKDVAQRAGVSVATVSAVARGASGGAVRISDETRRRVQEAIDALGYRPNRAAASLRTQRTGLIGIVVPDLMNPLFPEFVRAAQFQAEASDLHVMVWDSHNSEERERAAVNALLDRRVDGVVLVTDHLSVADIEPLAAAGVAVVTTDRRLDLPWVDMVSEDLVGTAAAATGHLLDLGHRRIAHVSGDLSTVVGAARLAGYQNALEASGIEFDPVLVAGGSFDRASAEQSVARLMSHEHPPTAVFAANDVLAVGVLRECARAGLALPSQLSVIGIDNTRESEVVSPGLTTMDPHPASIAERLVEFLTSRMTDSSLPARRELVGASLVLRASTHRLV